MSDVKRLHRQRDQEADRAHSQEARVREQVLGEGARRDGLRMTQSRLESPVSSSHFDSCHADSPPKPDSPP